MLNSFLKNPQNQSAQQLVILTEEQLKNFVEEIVTQTLEKIASAKKDDSDILITRKEACKILDRNPTTLWRWNRDGILKPASRSNKRIMYRKGDVEKILYGKSKLMDNDDE